MQKLLSIAKCLHNTKNISYKQKIISYLRQLFVLAIFILFSKLFDYEFEKKTIYMLGIVSVIAACANYGQIVLERKNYGIYECILGFGYNYNILLGTEVFGFELLNLCNFLFLIFSNSIFWFVISGEIELQFFLLYAFLVFATSIIFGILVIQSSFHHKNAPYWMSFSIFGVITGIMVMSITSAMGIVFLACCILNLIYYILHMVSEEWLY